MDKKQRRKLHRLERKELLIYLLGGSCVNCGSVNHLEFDHVMGDASFRICSRLDISLERLVLELQKCQLLCEDCHMDKTLEERGRERSTHGTTGMYVNHKCRCDKCRKAWTVYVAPRVNNWRIKKRSSII